MQRLELKQLESQELVLLMSLPLKLELVVRWTFLWPQLGQIEAQLTEPRIGLQMVLLSIALEEALKS